MADAGLNPKDGIGRSKVSMASGLSHIDKAIASLIVLRDSMLQGNWTDDRPPSAAPFMDAANADAARLTELHAGRTPRHYTIKDTAP
jgi:hypothetical protein